MTPWTRAALTICAAHHVSLAQVLGPHTYPAYVAARRDIALMLRGRGCSYPLIGRLLHRDHATIQNLVKGKVQGGKRHVVPVERAEALRAQGLSWRQVATAIGPINGQRLQEASVQRAVILARRQLMQNDKNGG